MKFVDKDLELLSVNNYECDIHQVHNSHSSLLSLLGTPLLDHFGSLEDGLD